MTSPKKFDRSNPGAVRGLLLRYRYLYHSSENHGAGARALHPGDVLYWVGCVGGISAILFVATR